MSYSQEPIGAIGNGTRTLTGGRVSDGTRTYCLEGYGQSGNTSAMTRMTRRMSAIWSDTIFQIEAGARGGMLPRDLHADEPRGFPMHRKPLAG